MKKLLLVLSIFLMGCGNAEVENCGDCMLSEGPNNPATAADDGSHGFHSWANTSNIFSSNNTYATASYDSFGQDTHWLVASNFGFNIPPTAVIVGILVEIEGLAAFGAGNVRLVKGGVIGVTNRTALNAFHGGEAYFSFGGSSDLWGETISPSDVNNSNFGTAVYIQRVSPGGATATIDHVRITVYYELPGDLGLTF